MSEVNAKKQPVDSAQALKLSRKVRFVFTVRGKKIVKSEVSKNTPSDEELARFVLGPSGKLRAPAIRVGNTLVVGFHEETWAGLLS